uniref:Olfactory receptor n=1 Tax=Monodelphis domestica TaxID=13616 RepID=F7C5K6_MONDO
ITVGNQTGVSEFFLLAFSSHQDFLFLLFLVVYLASLLGNLLILMAVSSDPQLQTPMYIFLANLSLGDLCFTSTTVPRLLYSLFTRDQTISHTACLTQVFFFHMAGNLSSYVLAAMAWDRYVAICRPLHYATVVTLPRCLMLLGGLWVGTSLHSLLNTVLTARLTFCSHHDILHFHCDIYPLLQLACSDTSLNYEVILIEGSIDIILPAACIITSYGFIGVAVIGVRATGGLHKALATCGSHLAVVMLFYGTLIIVYLLPLSQAEAQVRGGNLVASVMFSVVAPTLNPYIYSLQNHKIKLSLARLLRVTQ